MTKPYRFLEADLVQQETGGQTGVMLGRTLSALVLMVLATRADALEIVESNFQHIDTRLGKQLFAEAVPPGILLAPIKDDWLELSSSNGTIYSSTDRLGAFLAPAIPGNVDGRFILSFDEPVCVIGLQLKSEYPAPTDRTHFSLVFLDREDDTIQQMDRWPARGTSLQAFSARDTISGFRKVIIDNLDDEPFGLREVRALLCAVPIS